MGGEVSGEDSPEVGFCCPIRRAVVVRQIEVRDSPVERSTTDLALRLPWAIVAEVVPIKWLKEIAAGRQENGVDYIHALLTSYHDKVPAYAADANGKLAMVAEAGAVKDSPRCASVTPNASSWPSVPMKYGLNASP